MEIIGASGRQGITALLVIGLVGLVGCTLISTLPPSSPLPLPTEIPGGPTYAHVRFVKATEQVDGLWKFEVTVQHADEGPEHYADRWELLIPLPDGKVQVYTYEMTHPHVEEQPFTRSMSGVEIPEGVTRITVRAHDSRDGYGGQEVQVDLSQPSGPGYQVVRQ